MFIPHAFYKYLGSINHSISKHECNISHFKKKSFPPLPIVKLFGKGDIPGMPSLLRLSHSIADQKSASETIFVEVILSIISGSPPMNWGRLF